MKPLSLFGLFLAFSLSLETRALDYAGNIAPLITPAKLATLHSRGANPRIQKCVYWLEEAIIPRAVVPELDCVVANLELLPLKLNESKNAKVGPRQRDLAQKLHKAELLTDAGLAAVAVKH